MLRLFQQLYTIRNLFFVIAEAFFIYSAVIVTSYFMIGTTFFEIDKFLNFKAFIISFVSITCLYYNNVYDLSITKNYSELGIRLLQAFGASLIILAGIYGAFNDVMICRGFFIVYLPIVMISIASWRFIFMSILKKGFLNEKIILLGSGEICQGIIDKINEQIDCGFTLVGVIEEANSVDNLKISQNIIKIHGYDNLYTKAKQRGVNKIVVAIREKRGSFPINELMRCRVEGLEIIQGNSFYEMLTGKLIVSSTNPTWFIFSEGFRKTWFKTSLKRFEDIIASLILLIGLSPVIILTSILIKADSKGPLIYSQERLGKRKKPYKVHKFRSMKTDAEHKTGPVWAKVNDDRITRIGHFIRKWRIDEIPQLWNVLRGDMSLVGPRPEREFFIKQLEEKIPFYSERFSVKPGLTGWAQVCYGYGDSIEDAIEKLNYDLFYIKNLSIFMDIVIIFRTVKTVIFGVGAR